MHKKIFVLISLVFSFSTFASYHFQCYQVITGERISDKLMLLIPDADDLRSGASFSSAEDDLNELDFSFSTNNGRWITMKGPEQLILKIQSKGNERDMKIMSADKTSVSYRCFIESSV